MAGEESDPITLLARNSKLKAYAVRNSLTVNWNSVEAHSDAVQRFRSFEAPTAWGPAKGLIDSIAAAASTVIGRPASQVRLSVPR